VVIHADDADRPCVGSPALDWWVSAPLSSGS
jgi:hypothetical protein